jgi:peroxiredoxin
MGTAMALTWVALACVGLVAAAALWLAYQNLLQHGRLLLQFERLEQEMRTVLEAVETSAGEAGRPGGTGPAASTWAVGSVAPDFELPTASGGTSTLSRWRGRRVLLTFVAPSCEASRRLLQRLGAAGDRELDAMPLLVSTGPASANRELVARFGVRHPLLVQEEREVAAVYRADGTPVAFLVDEQGFLASSPARGLTAVLALAGLGTAPNEVPNEAPDAAPDAARPEPRAVAADFTPSALPPILTGSRLRRNGLRPGEPAPAFRLPDLRGEERSLDEFVRAGPPLLLVFSDPECAPCDALMPELQRLHRERADELTVLVVSRGDARASRDKAARLGLTFPILLQRQWEVSRAYALFATPVGYLIDGRGVIAAPVAVGGPPVLALAEDARRLADARAVLA